MKSLIISHLSGLKNPFAIDVFESLLYWVSQEKGDVVQMDKFGRGINQTIQSGLLMPRAVKIFHQKRYDQTSKYILKEIKNYVVTVQFTECWLVAMLQRNVLT